MTERKDQLDNDMTRWDTLMEQRRDKEVEYMTLRERRVDDYGQQLQQLRIQDAEEYNMVKIKLETDVQVGRSSNRVRGRSRGAGRGTMASSYSSYVYRTQRSTTWSR